jgi:hypothetical protein
MAESTDSDAVPSSLLEAQSAALRRLMPPIDAFGIGGSHGRGTADGLADLDFFVVVSADTFWEVVHGFPTLIQHPLAVVSRGVGRFMSDYGYRLGFILAGNYKVEYFFNSPETMTSLPLSARIRVIEDPSGWLSALLARSRAAFEADPSQHVAAGVHDCLLEIHDLRKHASRGDLIPMIWRLNTLRRPVLALHHMRVSGEVYAPSSAVSRLGTRYDDSLLARVDASVPTNDPASVAAAYRELRALMLSAWAHFAPTGVPTPEQKEAERELSDDVLRQLGSQLARVNRCHAPHER